MLVTGLKSEREERKKETRGCEMLGGDVTIIDVDSEKKRKKKL